MKIIHKRVHALLILMLLVGLMSCTDEAGLMDEKLNGAEAPSTAIDVSSRISGFNSEVSGSGATLTALGSNLQDVKRVMVAGRLAQNVISNDSEVSFVVPAGVPLGNQEVLFIFAGSERATSSIEIVPLPVIDYFSHVSASGGEVITVYGSNFDFVTGVNIGSASANIGTVSSSMVTFTYPSGASTAPVSLVSAAGTGNSGEELISCSADPQNPYCLPILNGNGGFEDATIGVMGNGGAFNGGWFSAGGVPGQIWSIIESTGGVPGLGDKMLQIELNEALNSGNDSWRIQAVNNGPANGEFDGYAIPANRRFRILGRIWADMGGRVITVAPGRRTPCCGDWAGSQYNLSLSAGWNTVSFEAQPSAGDHDAGNRDTHGTIQLNVNYNANIGGVLRFDDFRMVEIGPYIQ